MTNNLKSGERLDDLQLNGLQIIQDPERFCFGIDAVMLSDFARVKPGEKVLDLGDRNRDLTDFIVRKDQRRAFYRT